MYYNGMNKDYFNAMDRDYSPTALSNYGLDNSYSVGGPAPTGGNYGLTPHNVDNSNPDQVIPEIGLSPGDIGVSASPLVDVGQAVRARIFQGAKAVEIGFMGTDKGSGQSRTPESYGKGERMNIRELAKVNQVNLTTHAAFGMGSIAGFSQQSGGFDDNLKRRNFHEIQRAIDFAADVSNGGAVVVHADEHHRPLFSAGDDDEYKNSKDMSKNAFGFHGEEKSYNTGLVTPSGGLQRINASNNIKELEYKTDEKGNWIDKDGKDLGISKGIFFREIQPEFQKRKFFRENPNLANKYNIHSNTPDKDIDNAINLEAANPENPYFSKEMSRKVLEAQRNLFDKFSQVDFKKENGNFVLNDKTWEEVTEEAKSFGISPEKFWLTNYVQENLLTSQTNSNYKKRLYGDVIDVYDSYENGEPYQEHYKRAQKEVIEKKIKKLQELESEDSEELKAINMTIKNHQEKLDKINRGEIDKEEYNKHKEQVSEYLQTGAEEQKKIEGDLFDYLNFRDIKEVTNERVADNLAQSALYAKQREDVEKKHNPEAEERITKPLFIAFESVFPENYGGHPDEIKDMIKDSRKKFVEIVTGKDHNYSSHPMFNSFGGDEQGAKKEAERRLKGVWDTGHVNIWRKYMKNLDQEGFKKWYVKKAQEWIDEGIMGHVHVTENLGWHDEHLIPGEGNTPIREVINLVKEKAQDADPEEKIAIITEPAHHDFKAMLGSWNLFGSSIYGATQNGFKESWLDIQSGYFGRSYGSHQTYGGLVAHQNDTQSWSNLGFE